MLLPYWGRKYISAGAGLSGGATRRGISRAEQCGGQCGGPEEAVQGHYLRCPRIWVQQLIREVTQEALGGAWQRRTASESVFMSRWAREQVSAPH